MAFLFHSQLGRFSAPDDAHHSATDSDSYYGAGQRRRFDGRGSDRETRREAGITGEPGSRRHRRHLNNTFGDYESEYDTASDFDSDEDRPIVRFEWGAQFVEAGQDFFHRNADAAPRQRRSDKLQRRAPKMVRRARGAAPLEHAPEEMESESHAHARRVRAAKFASAHAAGAASAAAVLPPAAAAAAQTTSATDSEAEHKLDSSADPTVAVGLQRSRISEKKHHRSKRGIAGQESAGTLFLGMEHGVRRALRKNLSAHEESFLTELEALLVAYKNGLTKRGVPAPILFDVLTGAGSGASSAVIISHHNGEVDDEDEDDEEEDAEQQTEATSDDEGVVHVNVTGKATKKSKSQPTSQHQQRRLACGDEPLNLSFRGPRERYLAHGMASFHQLVCESHDQPAPSHSASSSQHPLRITQIRIPSRGVLLHDASLMRYLHKLQHVPSRSLTR